MKNILLYHKGCPDGFGSAYAFWKKFGNNMEYVAVSHSDAETMNFDIIQNKNVYMADICFKKKTMDIINQKAASLQVLDHHISAQKEMEEEPYCKFVQNQSGSVISWEYNFPNTSVPKILECVQDRDLYNWTVPNSAEILAVLDSEPYDFFAWDNFEKRLIKSRKSIVSSGAAVLKANAERINRLCSKHFFITIAGIEVPALNISLFQSECLSILAKDLDTFSASYYFDGDKYVFSLRSGKNGMDVSEIAAKYGGGGHRAASGFSVRSLTEL